jgi:hypothetical protein
MDWLKRKKQRKKPTWKKIKKSELTGLTHQTRDSCHESLITK